MRTTIIAALLAAAAFPAEAQTLYRCVEKGKPTSYQNVPCPDAAKTASAIDYVPERSVPARYPTVASARPHYRRPARAQLHSIPRASSPTACDAAKRRRESVLGTNNQGGNVDLRRQLNDAVARDCY